MAMTLSIKPSQPCVTPVMARPRPVALLALGLSALTADLAPVLAQNTFGQSVQEQQIYDNSPTGRPTGVLESGNPLELMNKLRRGTAMDNATSPGDAIDQALRDLEPQPASAQGAVKAP